MLSSAGNERSQPTELRVSWKADGLVVPEAAVLARACALYGADSRLDFADAYLAANGLEAGPPTVASFDADLDRIPGIQRLST